jgi:hypothetical protein
MMSSNFNSEKIVAGDFVRNINDPLKRDMTVITINETQRAECHWRTDGGVKEWDYFDLSALMKIDLKRP